MRFAADSAWWSASAEGLEILSAFSAELARSSVALPLLFACVLTFALSYPSAHSVFVSPAIVPAI